MSRYHHWRNLELEGATSHDHVPHPLDYRKPFTVARLGPLGSPHSDADAKWYPTSAQTYPLLATPKWFVTLHGSTHSAPFEDAPDPADAVVPPVTVAFWDRYLKGDKSAQTRLVGAVQAYGQADLQRDLREVGDKAPAPALP